MTSIEAPDLRSQYGRTVAGPGFRYQLPVDLAQRASEQRFLDALNRARLARTRQLRRRHRDLTHAYRAQPSGRVVLDLAVTTLVLRERGTQVPADETVERVLDAVLVVSRTYWSSTDPGT